MKCNIFTNRFTNSFIVVLDQNTRYTQVKTLVLVVEICIWYGWLSSTAIL
jgi:VanZ family protein